MEEHFSFDKRLGIYIPDLALDWDEYTKRTQSDILLCWEQIRGSIPDRIADLEHEINHKQEQLSDESDFNRSCQLNSEIADLASIINDLWLWYRTDQTITEKIHH